MTIRDSGDAAARPGLSGSAPSPSGSRPPIPIAAPSEDDIDRLIGDPALIETHEQALEVLDVLDREIAHIQTQVDAAQIEAGARGLPPERQDWVRRASYACAMKRNERHRVMQRDKELRGTKGPAQTARKDPREGIAKQERLKAEADARKAVAAAKIAAVAAAKTINAQFVRLARQRLGEEIFCHLLAEAKKLAAALKAPASGIEAAKPARPASAGLDPKDESPTGAAGDAQAEGGA